MKHRDGQIYATASEVTHKRRHEMGRLFIVKCDPRYASSNSGWVFREVTPILGKNSGSRVHTGWSSS